MAEVDNGGTSRAERLNSLLRAERSAAETYDHVLRKAKGKGLEELRRIRDEHKDALALLRAEASRLGADPESEATTWKNLSVIAEIAGEPLSDPFALKALKEGEEQDLLTYESALKDAELDREVRELIDQRLLPLTRSHIPVLEGLLAAA